MPRRTWPAVIALVVPALSVLVTGALMGNALPEQVAFHWNAGGRPDGHVPTEPLFWVCLGLSAALFALGLLVVLLPSRDQADTRRAMAIIGSVAGFVAAIWLVPACAAYAAVGTGGPAVLGGLLLLFVGGLAYGAVTGWATPPTGRA